MGYVPRYSLSGIGLLAEYCRITILLSHLYSFVCVVILQYRTLQVTPMDDNEKHEV